MEVIVPDGAPEINILKASPGLWQERSVEPRPIYWLVDCSGSMMSHIGSLQNALHEQHKTLRENYGLAPWLVPFNHMCLEPMRFETEDWKLTACGGTNFTEALMTLMNHVERTYATRTWFCVLFFTDGYNMGHLVHHDRTIFVRFLDEIFDPWTVSKKCELHVIGYSVDHDVQTMERMVTSAGTSKSYQYAPSHHHLRECMQSVVEQCILGNSAIRARIGDSWVTLYEADNYQQGIKAVCWDDQDHIAIEQNGIQKVVPLAVRREDYGDNVALVGWKINILTEEARRPGLTIESMKELGDQCRRVIRDDIMTQRSKEVRAELMKKATALLDLLNEFRQALAAIYLRDSTDNRAKLLQLKTMPTARFNKDRFKRVLEERLLTRCNMSRNIAEEASKASQALRETGEIGKEDAEEWSCMLTTNTYEDAMLDEDCMCVTMMVQRTEVAAAVEPANLRILRVNLQCMTLSGFLDCLKTVGNKEDAVVNFDLSQNIEEGSVITDRILLPCNAAFPLYLDERHWSVAKHLMKRALGWMCGGDERAYTKRAWEIVPLLIMANLAKTPAAQRTSCFQKFREAIRRTAQEMCTDSLPSPFTPDSLREYSQANPAIALGALEVFPLRLSPEETAALKWTLSVSQVDRAVMSAFPKMFPKASTRGTKKLAAANLIRIKDDTVLSFAPDELKAYQKLQGVVRYAMGDVDKAMTLALAVGTEYGAVAGMRSDGFKGLKVENEDLIKAVEEEADKIISAQDFAEKNSVGRKLVAWKWFIEGSENEKLPVGFQHCQHHGLCGYIYWEIRHRSRERMKITDAGKIRNAKHHFATLQRLTGDVPKASTRSHFSNLIGEA